MKGKCYMVGKIDFFEEYVFFFCIIIIYFRGDCVRCERIFG